VIDELIRAKPSAAKGRYLRTVTITSTAAIGHHGLVGVGDGKDPRLERELEAT
jgi:hypothetical protein